MTPGHCRGLPLGHCRAGNGLMRHPTAYERSPEERRGSQARSELAPPPIAAASTTTCTDGLPRQRQVILLRGSQLPHGARHGFVRQLLALVWLSTSSHQRDMDAELFGGEQPLQEDSEVFAARRPERQGLRIDTDGRREADGAAVNTEGHLVLEAWRRSKVAQEPGARGPRGADEGRHRRDALRHVGPPCLLRAPRLAQLVPLSFDGFVALPLAGSRAPSGQHLLKAHRLAARKDQGCVVRIHRIPLLPEASEILRQALDSSRLHLHWPRTAACAPGRPLHGAQCLGGATSISEINEGEAHVVGALLVPWHIYVVEGTPGHVVLQLCDDVPSGEPVGQVPDHKCNDALLVHDIATIWLQAC
mmetsp:Transcript_15633/g.45112  ORF Transcript_15633/g.45112 Transcript_15633/m.45112 type:complete len:361 (-) Transcript_15633:363-1445(-)